MNLLDLIFPKRCVGCGKFGQYFCEDCRQRMHCIQSNERRCAMCGRFALDGITHHACRTRTSIDGAISFFRYDGVVQKGIKAIKYRYISNLAVEFVSLTPRISVHAPIIIPIPLHQRRYNERGFNQAEVMARELAKRLQVNVQTDILTRVKYTDPQAGRKHKKDRLDNMRGAFSLNKKNHTIPKSCILFDDVFTTGATMREATKALKSAGVKEVWTVTMAR